jgi:hypothetical protein
MTSPPAMKGQSSSQLKSGAAPGCVSAKRSSPSVGMEIRMSAERAKTGASTTATVLTSTAKRAR